MPQLSRVKKIFLLMLCFSLFPFIGDGGKSYAQSSWVRPSEQMMRNDVEFLSDSLCSGRKSGTVGAGEAATYIFRRLRNLGYDVQQQNFRKDSIVFRNIIARPAASSESGSSKCTLVMAYYDGMGVIGDRMYPGADSNASGVAAALSLAEVLKGRKDLIFAFVDGHNANSAGAIALRDSLSLRKIRMMVNLDIIGSTLAPVESAWKRFMIVLGGSAYENQLQKLNSGLGLHLYYSYYRSRSFTELFYRKVSDHRFFLGKGFPVLFFTSGITMNTNRTTDTAETLDYSVLAKRVELIARLVESQK